MKTRLSSLILLTVFSLTGITHASSDDDLKQASTQRLQNRYGLTLDPSQLSLQALNEIESRLALCFSLMKKQGRLYDYRTTSLAFLQDLESRLDACERIKKNYNILLRPEYYTASALTDLEGRISVASRIYQTYGKEANWRDSSLKQLQTAETQLAAVQAPLPKPHTQPLAKSGLVFSSVSSIPRGETVTATMADTSYASASYIPSYSTSYSSFPAATPVGRCSRRVTSAPTFYSTYNYGYSGYNTPYSYGYNSGYGYNYTPYCSPPYVSPCVNIQPPCHTVTPIITIVNP